MKLYPFEDNSKYYIEVSADLNLLDRISVMKFLNEYLWETDNTSSEKVNNIIHRKLKTLGVERLVKLDKAIEFKGLEDYDFSLEE